MGAFPWFPERARGVALRARLLGPPAPRFEAKGQAFQVSPMPGGAPPWVEVAAAVIERPDGSFLLAQRPAGKVYAGWWEFPGGKCEPGEAPVRALARELEEELGLFVRSAVPWITCTHEYAHARVRLHFFRVLDWQGEPQGREGQSFSWQRLPALDVSPVLPANGPVLRSLSLPLFMGITQAAVLGETEALERLDLALAEGLRLVQIREPDLQAPVLEGFSRKASARIRAAGGIVVLNGPEALAREVGVDGVHLSARALLARPERPDFSWVGASCHNGVELDRAEELGFDYAVLGPVLPTATHPGATGMGWESFGRLVSGRSLPVYAIGGLERGHLGMARAAGAHGIAAIRSAWIAKAP